MMYTRERLMKAVRDAGRDGRQFTLGEVRAELGVKSRDKREQKRFRSRFRECTQALGDNLEKLGPNTFRLKAAYIAAHPPATLPKRKRDAQDAQPDDAPVSLMDRVGVAAAASDDEWKRRPREQISFVKADVATAQARQLSFGERVSSWFGKREPGKPQLEKRVPNSSAASVALSRLAVELQPKATGFEYRWIDGKLEVQRANK